jgi:hypothetical protein
VKGILKEATVRKLKRELTPKGVNIVWAWCQSDPKQVKEWESEGTLLEIAKAELEKANKVEEMARRDGMTHLASHEIYELYGGPNLRL